MLVTPSRVSFRVAHAAEPIMAISRLGIEKKERDSPAGQPAETVPWKAQWVRR